LLMVKDLEGSYDIPFEGIFLQFSVGDVLN
jgi:hypothetical protein